MEDINLLLSYIETEVLKGKKTFMGNGTVINGENVLNLVQRIRISFNELDGSNVLAEATSKAQRIIAEAEQRKEQILDESIILAEAKAMASKINEDAQKRKTNTETITSQNVIKNLDMLQQSLKGISAEIDNSIKYFANQYVQKDSSKK